MGKTKKDFWFPARKDKFGWGLPVTWQGWVVLVLYFVLMFCGGWFVADFPSLAIPYVIYVVTLTGIVVFICWKKGEKTEFRWGVKL